MRLCRWVWMATAGFGLALFGCAGSMENVLSQNQTIMTITPVSGHVKKVAMVQTPLPDGLFDQKSGDLFFTTLAKKIRQESAELLLQTSEEEGVPDFMAALAGSARPINAEALSREGRRSGYNGLITTAVHNIRTESYKSGIFWFRKTRHRIMFEVTLDLYDPFTGSKVMSVLEEDSAVISKGAYDDYKGGAITPIEDLDDVLVDLAEEIGEAVAETLADLPWQVSILQADGQRVHLPAGGQAGLQVGQRLAVIQGQRLVNGVQGESFIVPGKKIGEIIITQVGDQTAYAKVAKNTKVESGDIAIPIER